MKIHNIIHAYPPVHNAGAEYFVHELNKYYIEQGHEVTVSVALRYKGSEYEGVNIVSDSQEYSAKADLIVTHLDKAGTALNQSRKFKKPLVHYAHNFHVPLNYWNRDNSFVVFNSKVMAQRNGKKIRRPFTIYRPIVNPSEYKKYRSKEQRQYITLVNCNRNKGGAMLEQVAKAMPDEQFLAVKGMYGEQHESYPDNVTVINNTPNKQEYLDKTKIMLVMSKAESWGIVAGESMASGIPVVYSSSSKCVGLQEQMGYAGIENKDYMSVTGWMRSIKQANDNLEGKGSICIDRANSLWKNNDRERLMQFLTDIVERRIK